MPRGLYLKLECLADEEWQAKHQSRSSYPQCPSWRALTEAIEQANGNAADTCVRSPKARIVPTTFEPYPNQLALGIEHEGTAKLRGKTLRQRANELTAFAHPDCRAELRKEAQRLYWPWSRWANTSGGKIVKERVIYNHKRGHSYLLSPSLLRGITYGNKTN